MSRSEKQFSASPSASKKQFSASLMCAALAALVALAFWPVLHAGFIYVDDPDYVTLNVHVRQGLTWPGLVWAFRSISYASNWHPVTWLTHMLDVQLYGLNPAGHHLTNLLLHTASTLLLFLLLRRWTGAFWRSALVAALFGLHPLRVESVAWISERKDVLSAFFGLLTLWAYGRYVEKSPPSPRLRRTGKIQVFYGLALLFFALGLMSKPMLVTWPVLLLLLDFWPLGRVTQIADCRPLIIEKLPFFVLALADAAITIWSQSTGGSMLSLNEFPLGLRVGNAFVTYLLYLARALWPANLAVYYPFSAPWPLAVVLLCVLALAGVSILAIVKARRHPWLFTGWFWYVLVVTPVIGFLHAGKQSSADRYTYLPLIGIFILITWAAAAWAKTVPRRNGLAVLAVAAVVIMVTLTRQQSRYWQSNEILFHHALAVTKDNWMAHYYTGIALIEHGNTKDALPEIQTAARILPDYGNAHLSLGLIYLANNQPEAAVPEFESVVKTDPLVPEGHFQFGQALARLGRLDEAIPQYQTALRLNPALLDAQYGLANAWQRAGRLPESMAAYRAVIKTNPLHPTAHNHLGAALAAVGQTTEALAEYDAALKINPDYAEAFYNRGNIFFAQGNNAAAITNYLAALARKPNYPKAENTLACALDSAGRPVEAIQHFVNALKLAPDYAEVHYNLGNVLRAQNHEAEALAHLEEASRLSPDDPKILAALADTYASSRQWAKAETALQKAIQLVSASGPADWLNELQAKLKQYQSSH